MLSVAERMNPLFHLMLVMANETGHRIEAVRQLQWSDIDLDRGLVTWRAEHDKMRQAHMTPLSAAANAGLTGERLRQPAIGDSWIFPAPENAAEPISRYLPKLWWKRAAPKAGLPKIKGLGWHSLRRKFATELKDAPIKDLAHLGGWKNPQTILICYEQPEEDRMRAALEKRRPVTALAS